MSYPHQLKRAFRFPAMIALAFFVTACGGDSDSRVVYTEGDINQPRPAGVVNERPIAQFFPADGYRGLVLNRCSSCHSVACTLVGDRDVERWRAIEVSHQSYVPGMSMEDRGKIFDYLVRHFPADSTKPDVPEEFLEGGCPELPANVSGDDYMGGH